MTITTPATIPTTMSTVIRFGPELIEAMCLNNLTETDQQKFLKNISELIIETTLSRYLLTLTEDDQSAFETWINAHKTRTNFLKLVQRVYPDFIAILEAEIVHFQQEVFRLSGVIIN